MQWMMCGLLQSLLTDEQVANAPVLVLGNKIDKPGAASEDEIRHLFGLHNLTTGKVSQQHTTPIRSPCTSCLPECDRAIVGLTVGSTTTAALRFSCLSCDENILPSESNFWNILSSFYVSNTRVLSLNILFSSAFTSIERVPEQPMLPYLVLWLLKHRKMSE